MSSVEGNLELLSHRGQLRAAIKEIGSGNSIWCSIPDEMLEQFKPLFDKRVIVEGLVNYRENGSAVSVTNVTQIRERKSSKSLLEYVGTSPNLTGGLSTDEFMDQIRGDD